MDWKEWDFQHIILTHVNTTLHPDLSPYSYSIIVSIAVSAALSPNTLPIRSFLKSPCTPSPSPLPFLSLPSFHQFQDTSALWFVIICSFKTKLAPC